MNESSHSRAVMNSHATLFKSRNTIKLFGIVAGILIAAVFFNYQPIAADTIPSGGISVSPYLEQISVNPSQTADTYTIELTNHYSSSVLIRLSTQDFKNLNESGQVEFLTSTQDRNNPYSIDRNLQFPYSEIAIGPNQSRVIPVTIANIQQLATGGHYGAIIFKITGVSSPGNNVVINQAVASLLFLSTIGQGTQSLSMTTPLVSSLMTSFPSSINAVFSNGGNTQTVPHGVIQITNSALRNVSQGQINSSSSLILPKTRRLFPIPLENTGQRLWPGYYHLNVYYRYAGQTQYSVYREKFFYISKYLLLCIFCLAIFIVLVVKYRYYLIPQKEKTKQKKIVEIIDTPKRKKISVTHDSSEETIIKIRPK